MKKKVLTNLFATTLVLASLPTISNFSNWEVTAFAQENIIDDKSGITDFYISKSHNMVLGNSLTLNPDIVKGSDFNDVSWKIKYDFGTNAKLVGNVLTPSSTGTIIITGTLTTDTGTYQKDFPVCVTNVSLSNSYSHVFSSNRTTLGLYEGYSSSDTTSTFSLTCSSEVQYNVMGYLEGDDSDKFEIVKSPSTTLAKNVRGEFEVQLKEGLPAGVYSTYITLCSSALVTCEPTKITVTVRESVDNSSNNTTTQVTTQNNNSSEPTTQVTTQNNNSSEPTTQVTTQNNNSSEPTTQVTTQNNNSSEPTTQVTTQNNNSSEPTTQVTTQNNSSSEPTTQSTTQNNNSSNSGNSNTSSVVSSRYNRNMPTLASTTPLNKSGATSSNLVTSLYEKNYKSNLIEATNGYIRIEQTSLYNITYLVVEEYNNNFELVSEKTIDFELPTFVAFHEGIDNYYLMFSDTNSSELASKEVVRVVKYDKNWNKLDTCSISNINTVGSVSSADMVEFEGNLLIHTRHTMYKANDGYNHQANLRFGIDIETMNLKEEYSKVMNHSQGYVSHSFNQMIDVSSDGFLVTADRGDAYPRSFIVFNWNTPSIVNYSGLKSAQVLDFYGDIGNNSTNSTMGALEVGTEAVLLAGSSAKQNSNAFSDKNYNIFVTATPRDNFSTSSSSINWITSYSGDTYGTSPHLVEITEDKFILIWNEVSTSNLNQEILCYQEIDGNGKSVGSTKKLTGQTSSVRPIVNSEGNILWYTTNKSAPVFYELNINTGTVRAINTSMEETNIESTTESTTITTTTLITEATTEATTQAPTYNNNNSSSNNSSSSNNNITLSGASSWATTYIEDANTKNLLKNMSDVTSNYQGSINREQFCRLIMNCFDSLGGTRPNGYSTTFTDTTNSEIIHANMLGIVNGKSDTRFAPNDLITREELAIMSKNMIDLFEDIPLTNTTADFTDSKNISSWALNQVIFAQQEGILQGNHLGQILPLDNLSCEEAIIVVLRIFDKFDADSNSNSNSEQDDLNSDESLLKKYQKVIDVYNDIATVGGYSMMDNSVEYEDTYHRIYNDVVVSSQLVYYDNEGEGKPSNYKYDLVDINNDGVKELFIFNNNSLLGCYGINSAGEPVHILITEYRSEFSLYKDLTITEFASGGAFSGGISSVSFNGESLYYIESYTWYENDVSSVTIVDGKPNYDLQVKYTGDRKDYLMNMYDYYEFDHKDIPK